MILSCQSGHIEEIPLLKRAIVSAISLRDQRKRSGGEAHVLSERDLDLSGLLMCWHLWSSRGVPLSPEKRGTESQRKKVVESREKTCQSLLTLRKERLYMAIEKYLLFLMPREISRKRVVPSLDRSVNDSLYKSLTSVLPIRSRRKRAHLSAFYVDTALGVCQYQFEKMCLQNVLPPQLEERRGQSNPAESSVAFTIHPKAGIFSSGKTWFPRKDIDTTFALNHERTQQNRKGVLQGKLQRQRTLREGLHGHALLLHCRSVLSSPEIQEVAESGLITLQGSVTLHL